MSIDLMPGFGAFTQSDGYPTFPAASAIQRVLSPDWAVDAVRVTKTTGQTDPRGGTEAVSLVSSFSGGVGGAEAGYNGDASGVIGSYVSSNTYTLSFFAKAVAGGTWIRVAVYDTGAGDAGCYFNVATGAIGDYRSGGASESNAGSTSFGNGWYQFWFSYPMTTTTPPTSHQIGIRSASDTNFDNSSAIATGDGFLIWRYQIVNGTNPNG
jgi:hypothetical protein